MLTDFGIARINSDGDDVCEEGMGSLRWMAPELLMPEGGSFACHTTATDVWAFGMTIYVRLFHLYWILLRALTKWRLTGNDC